MRSKNKKYFSLDVPNELKQFVQNNTYSLLIKGHAGTGKTTLSLTILKTLRIRSNFFYISTRLSPKQLFLYYPWLDKFIGQVRSSEPDKTSEYNYNLSSFEDARLDEPESLFERITNQLMDVKAPIIIIDSWDAIASFMDKEARINNERVLQTWRERAGAKLIFIKEDPNDSSLDFLVDGIVKLDQKFYNNIKIREIQLLKLRGVHINKSSYLYTLNNGTFRSFNPYHSTDFMPDSFTTINKKVEAAFDTVYDDQYIKSGYKELDVALGGGFPRKGIVIMEIEAYVNTKITIPLLARIISNFLRASNPILFYSQILDTNSIVNYLKSYLCTDTDTDIRNGIIFLPTNKVKNNLDHTTPYEYNGTTNTDLRYMYEFAVRARRENPNKLLLHIAELALPRKTYDQEEISAIQSILSIKRNIDLSIIISRHSQIIQELADFCDIHLRLTMIDGTLFLQSINPWTNIFAVVTGKSLGCPKIRLEPIV
jgi:KaiC/GvpD/RAD55 family RecA-like ATPase